MIDKLLEFVKQDGKIAVKAQKNLNNNECYNKERLVSSMVTETDINISNMFEEFIKKEFSNLNYMIIDEEKITKYSDNIFNKVNETEYQFVIDPIDGTTQYANNHHISLEFFDKKCFFKKTMCFVSST